jgi:hypothetical protein
MGKKEQKAFCKVIALIQEEYANSGPVNWQEIEDRAKVYNNTRKKEEASQRKKRFWQEKNLQEKEAKI